MQEINFNFTLSCKNTRPNVTFLRKCPSCSVCLPNLKFLASPIRKYGRGPKISKGHVTPSWPLWHTSAFSSVTDMAVLLLKIHACSNSHSEKYSAELSNGLTSGVARLPSMFTTFASMSSIIGVNEPPPVLKLSTRSCAAAFLDFFLMFSYACLLITVSISK